jgi:hypothetical protein
VAGERDLEPAAHDRAVHRGHHRHVHGFDRIEQRAIFGLARRAAELADVGAREEGASLAQQDHAADAAIGTNRRHGLLEPRAHVRGDGIDRGIVHDDERQLAVALYTNSLRHHSTFICGRRPEDGLTTAARRISRDSGTF